MHEARVVRAYDSQSKEYTQAFEVFLAHTDQKTKAREWLSHCVERLPRRRVFLDAGAGNGLVTSWVAPRFDRTLAIEPNETLRHTLQSSCKITQIMDQPIIDAQPREMADLVLCSHVFYYIPSDQWRTTLEKLASWLAPGGVAVVAIQHHESDGMRMVQHFLRKEFNLTALGHDFRVRHNSGYHTIIDVVPARVRVSTLEAAFTIAEFMLNTLPMPQPPRAEDLEHYLREHFGQADETYSWSCSQVFLTIQRR